MPIATASSESILRSRYACEAAVYEDMYVTIEKASM